MKVRLVLACVLNACVLGVVANSFFMICEQPSVLFWLVPAFLLSIALAGVSVSRANNLRGWVCLHGTVLLCAFCLSVTASAVWQIVLAVRMVPHDGVTYLWNLLLCFGVHCVTFWVGILAVYLTSAQLGVKRRVIGALCGMIPIANVVALFSILKTTAAECVFEHQKVLVNRGRKQQAVCATKYPLLLVHGVFFRDTRFFNYWGRIPKELKTNGATVFYGNHSSAASVADSAAELRDRILEVLAQTGAEKVNIIAHSKGGLDCRYAIAKLGIGERVASLTTINTPHRGCLFADRLLTKIGADIQERVANAYNAALKKLGDAEPDFLAAVGDLTEARCTQLNAEMPTPEGVYCQSVGSVLTKATHGTFPLSFSYHLVKHFSGDNDGLVSETSFAWGEKYVLLTPPADRGISHGDMIDLTRENIDGFDVREFYVELVRDLKNRGL